jgi:hypothetical protein
MVDHLIRSPGDAWLVARMTAWAIALRVLKRVVPLARLTRAMWRDSSSRKSPHGVEEIVALVRRACRLARLRRQTNCLERSLIGYRYLAAANASPRLVTGVRRVGQEVHGHAWVEVDGQPVLETREIGTFVPLVAFGKGGEREELTSTRETVH